MKRSRWLTLRRAASKATSGSSSYERRPSSHFSFERLQPRLVFALQLDLGPVADTVVVSPAPQVGQFSVSSGPELAKELGPAWVGTFAGQSLYQTTGSLSVQSSN